MTEPVRLLHHDGTDWVDITTTGEPGEVCGESASLSPFAVATAAEPVVTETVIDSGPPATTATASATFFFSSDAADATFECSLDGGLTWSSCESPHIVEGLGVGAYELLVAATSTDDVVDTTPASHAWTVVAARHDDRRRARRNHA